MYISSEMFILSFNFVSTNQAHIFDLLENKVNKFDPPFLTSIVQSE